MYGKLFAQMYDGTLGTKGPWQALVTFQQLIILADKNGDVDMTAEAIARRTTIPLDVVRLGLVELEKPDPHSRSPAQEGRRIVRLSDARDWGWHIVNYDEYRKLRSQEERREYMRQYQRDRRAKRAGNADDVNQNVNLSTRGERSQPIAVSRKQDAEAEVEPTLWYAVWQDYPKRAGGNSRAAALKAYAARLKSGASEVEMLDGVRRYAEFVKATGKEGTEYVKQAATFFGPAEHWKEPWDLPRATGKANKLDETNAALLRGAAKLTAHLGVQNG